MHQSRPLLPLLLAAALALAGCNTARRSPGVFAGEGIAPPPSLRETPEEAPKAGGRSARAAAAPTRAARRSETDSVEASPAPETVRPVMTPTGRPGAGFQF